MFEQKVQRIYFDVWYQLEWKDYLKAKFIISAQVFWNIPVPIFGEQSVISAAFSF